MTHMEQRTFSSVWKQTFLLQLQNKKECGEMLDFYLSPRTLELFSFIQLYDFSKVKCAHHLNTHDYCHGGP